MSQIEMACTQAQWDCCLTKLRDVLTNPSAIQRYTIMHDNNYVHPGWVDYQKKHAVRRIRK